MQSIPVIGFIDSGIGGLTILQAVRRVLEPACFVYCADKDFFPYGTKTEDEICERLLALASRLCEVSSLDVLVIACNTASTVALEILRKNFSIPIVGVVPAIKPAALLSKSQSFAVLATQATAARSYTHDLIRRFAPQCLVKIIGSKELVEQAERKVAGLDVDLLCIQNELSPIIEDISIDTVVLACTHFPHLMEEFCQVIPRSLSWLEPGEAIAKRVLTVLAQKALGKRDNKECQYYYYDTAPINPSINYAQFFPAPPVCKRLSL